MSYDIRNSAVVSISAERKKFQQSLAIADSSTVLPPEHVFTERERLSQYNIVSDEFNIFRSEETFEQLKDGNLTDCACALLNGRQVGRLWIGLSS